MLTAVRYHPVCPCWKNTCCENVQINTFVLLSFSYTYNVSAYTLLSSVLHLGQCIRFHSIYTSVSLDSRLLFHIVHKMDVIKDTVNNLFGRKPSGPKIRYAVVGAGSIAQSAFMPGILETKNSGN